MSAGGVICPFCDHVNAAERARCAQCDLPIDLTQCGQCEAVNSSASSTCHRCGGLLHHDVDAQSTGLRFASVPRDTRLAEMVGSWLGFALVIALLSLGLLRVLHRTGEEAPTPSWLASATLPDAMEALSPHPVEALLPFPAIAQASDAPRNTAPRSRTRHVVTRASVVAAPQASQHQDAATPIVAVPAPLRPPGGAAVVSYAAPALPARTYIDARSPFFVCTAPAIAEGHCRPEGLMTGQ